jgi:hypothetical protein
MSFLITQIRSTLIQNFCEAEKKRVVKYQVERYDTDDEYKQKKNIVE